MSNPSRLCFAVARHTLKRGALLLIFGCADKMDTGEPAVQQSDTGAQDDTDTGGAYYGGWDTAFYLFYAGDARTAGTAFLDGHFGYAIYEDFHARGEVFCLDQSVWSDAGTTPPAGCPDCEWAFTLDLSDAVAVGDGCDRMLPDPLTGGEWDGFTASWGFADSYTYSVGGADYLLDTVIFYYSTYPGYEGWNLLSYNYGDQGYNTGDASDVTFLRYAGYVYAYP